MPACERESSPADSLLRYEAADAAAPVVSHATILENDRFWPYHTSLSRGWTPPGGSRSLDAGSKGVLIRVEDGTSARIDFGRDGIFAVPIDHTDLVAETNRVRVGELAKAAPNLVAAIGPRLLDPDTVAPISLEQPFESRYFLCVFADIDATGFAQIAVALSPLQARAGLMTIVFAQGRHRNAEIAAQLRQVQWRVPFLLDHVAEAYTRTLIDPDVGLPAISLQTADGRLLYQASWGANTFAELAATIDGP